MLVVASPNAQFQTVIVEPATVELSVNTVPSIKQIPFASNAAAYKIVSSVP